ncbi:MAG TPA: multicopper oxidase domain-containing protein [Pyrinomonadaceae bacterium]|nr:multicopper oxidase domain-containing protein [Pyrinomonadaceae bacterium]
MAYISKRNRRRERELQQALNNRLELVKEGFTRRDLMKMGLMTGAGVLIPKIGLTHVYGQDLTQLSSDYSRSNCDLGNSPQPAQVFVDPMPIPPQLPERQLTDPGLQFGAPPQICPNTAPNPNNMNLPFEGRGQFNGLPVPNSDCFQFFNQYPPQKYFVQRIRANSNFRITSDTNIPAQTIWGFNLGGSASSDVATFPGPTIVSNYQQPWLIRRFNELPTQSQNGGFGVPEMSTHLHNFHTAPESDGGPCRWFFRGQYFDYYFTAQQAGFASTHQPNGDINESLSTLWYHDHRIDHTAENTYKGLEGFHLIFNQFDTGNETAGFRLPIYPQYDIPIILTDKLLDPSTGKICFDTFNFKGLLGDVQLANGIVQPFFNVNKRRYRFRVLNGGPSRFYELFLTDPLSPSTVIPFWVIANDGNLLPTPIQVTSFRLSVAERYDIIIDFNQVKSLIGSHTAVRLENRLEQADGQGPTCNVFAGGDYRGTYCVEFRIGASAADGSVDPATHPVFYQLPSVITPRITRNFLFDRNNGQWVINDRFANCNELRFTVTQNSAENWVLTNPRNDWQHPIHIHLEEHQILNRIVDGGHHSSRSGSSYDSSRDCPFGGGGGGISTTRPGVPNVEVSRKDVTRLQFDEDATLFFRFRDFVGDWPMHCHNTVHEDHAMMLLFQVQPNVIDNNQNP